MLCRERTTLRYVVPQLRFGYGDHLDTSGTYVVPHRRVTDPTSNGPWGDVTVNGTTKSTITTMKFLQLAVVAVTLFGSVVDAVSVGDKVSWKQPPIETTSVMGPN